MPVVLIPAASTRRTALQIVQDACMEMGLPSPTTVFGSTDATIKQLGALLNREGKELAARPGLNAGWPQLRGEDQFDLTAYTGFTGNTTANSAVITGLNTTTNLAAGQAFLGAGIPTSTHISTVDSGTQVTLDRPATTTATGSSFTASVDSYALPTDLQYFIDATGWDRTRKWQLVGPITPQEWQYLKSGYPATGFLYRFRIMGTKMYFDPPPETTSRIVLEYYANTFVATAAGVAATSFTADTDYPILSDEPFTLGIKWRFKAAKGLEYAQELKTYEDCVERLMSRYAMARDLDLRSGPRMVGRIINYANVSDTGYGS